LTAIGALAVAVGAALILVLGRGATNNPVAGISWHVDKSHFRVSIRSDGKPLVEQDGGARLRYQVADGTQHSLTHVTASHGNVYDVATDEPHRTAVVTLTKRPHGVRLSLALSPSTGISQVYDAFTTGPDEHFMGGGESGQALDLRGQIVSVKLSYRCSYAPAPFFQSSAGYGLRLATSAVAAFAFPGSAGGTGCQAGEAPQCAFQPLTNRLEVCVKGSRLVEDVYAGDPAATLSAYLDDTGRSAVPPLSQYTLIKWRDEVTGPAQLLEDVRRLRGSDVPVGWVLLDNPWETCAGSLQWDTSRIPNPAGLVSTLRSLRVKLMLWISPDVYCPGSDGYPAGGLITTTTARELDLSNPAVVKEFKSRLEHVLSVGVAGVKGDRADEGDLEARGLTEHNRYPLLFQQAVVSVLRSLRGNDFATMFRAGAPGSQRVVHGFWNGDEPGDYIGLQRTIRQAATAGLAGMSVWGSDIGGYSSAQLTPDVFARWAQLGAVSPVFEVGGTGPNATPWLLGAAAMEALRVSANLHYALIPLFDDLVRRGQPVLRPLAYGYPHDDQAWRSDYELLVGPDLLAAPVTGQGTTPRIYLPAGTWVDLGTGGTIAGPSAFTRETPLDQLPLFVRAGSVVPFNLRTAKASLWGTGEVSHPGRAGYLATNGTVLGLRQQPRTVQVFVPAASAPAHVTIGKRPVQFTWVPGPMPGVVLRVAGPVVRGRISLAGA
jgi:alpha-D-xyloside xylohydrolase